MEINNIITIASFIAGTFVLSYLWDKKIDNDKKTRRRTAESFFIIFFGVAAAFVVIDNWLLIKEVGILNSNNKEIVKNNGLNSLFEWWGVMSFMVGIFLGMLLLSFIYKRILQTVRRFNIFSFYHYLKVRYHSARKFIHLISKINLVLLIPMVYYQVKLISVYLFPAQNSYISLLLIGVAYVLIFLFISNRNEKLPYLLYFTFAIIWVVLSFSTLQDQPHVIYMSNPDVYFSLTIMFLGFAYYISLPRNFSAYSYRKIENNKVNSISRSLFIGGFIFFLILFHMLPIGGFRVTQGSAQTIFLLILSFAVILSQLFYMKSHLYENFKKYTLFSKSLSNIMACFLFLVMLAICNWALETAELDASKLYLISLTYLPILLPSYFGGFVFRRAKGTSIVLSYVTGLAVWIYMVIIEEFLGFKIRGLDFQNNLFTQTFFPFLTAVIFYFIPAIFNKKDIIATSLIKPEENIIQSFLIDMGTKVRGLFTDPNYMSVFILFFDNKDKFYDIDFLTFRIRMSKTKLVGIIERLENDGWIYRKKTFFKYKTQTKEVEDQLYRLVTTFHAVENIFRKKVEEDFKDYELSVREKADEMDTQVSTVSLLNEISLNFSQIFNFKTLYRKIVELCVSNLGFEGAELFLIEKKETGYKYKPMAQFYSNFRHLLFSKEDYEKRLEEDTERLQLLEQPFAVINNPVELEKFTSLPEKYFSMAVLTIMNEDQPFAVIQVGYNTEDKTIGTQDRQKIEFLANSLSQSIIIISLYESLEEKIKLRTNELQKTNEELVQFNNALNTLNKEIRREMIAASAIQKAILPQEIPYPDRIELGAMLKAMPDETLSEQDRKKIEISGDYYDIFDIDSGKIGLLIADVTGHGVPSALITTMSKISFYTHALEGGTTAQICERVNKEIYEAIGIGDTGFYVTVFFAIYDTNTGILQYTNAGHYEGIIARKGAKELERINSEGFFIGSFEGAEYGFNETILKENDKFILFTDGIVELRNSKGHFYEDAFYERLVSLSSKQPQDIVNTLFDEMESFREDNPIKDDRTIVVLEAKKIANPATKLVHKDGKKHTEKELYEKTTADSDEFNKRFMKVVKDFNSKQYGADLEKEVDSLIEIMANVNLYYIKGSILKNKENYKEALEWFLKVEKLNPKNISNLNVIALTYYKIKNYAKAKEYWEKVLQQKPDMESAMKNLEVVKRLI